MARPPSVLASLAILGGASADPRHFFDPRCPPAAVPDPIGSVRWAPSRVFKTVTLNATATLADCATACCGDWSCIAYALDLPATGPLTGTWLNNDSLRGESLLTLAETADEALTATSLDPTHAFWHSAEGRVAADQRTLFLVFDGDPRNNRTGNVSANGTTITLSRVSFDPPGFSQVFTLVNTSTAGPTCTFMDERAPLSPRPAGSGMVTGSRAALPPPSPPPYATSTFIAAEVNATALLGVDGDEFPSTWASDGFTYSGAGDNTQPSSSIPQRYSSPASFFKVSVASPLDPAYPGSAFALQGEPFPLSDTDLARALCPPWSQSGIANIKSSGVLDLKGTMLWAVSCFNYGDDPTFNRQRYGPAWIASSTNAGLNWSTGLGLLSGGRGDSGFLFGGRLAAPRFIQAGRGYAGAPDPDFVYALFPGTENNASFFECNDAAWLGRAPVRDAGDIEALQLKSSWEFFVGTDSSDGSALWDADDTIAASVLDWPLHTSVQQVNWHPSLQRYILANWVWVSMDGYPRPDHSPDDRHDRTSRQRTWLTLLEAEQPWGPWRVFYEDDNWAYDDGSTGAYTPIFPAQWVNETDDSFWMVSTQCCGDPEFPPTNHYSFNAQHVSVRRL
jgi:hypothetical protein